MVSGKSKREDSRYVVFESVKREEKRDKKTELNGAVEGCTTEGYGKFMYKKLKVSGASQSRPVRDESKGRYRKMHKEKKE